jgi:hypothetical protein
LFGVAEILVEKEKERIGLKVEEGQTYIDHRIPSHAVTRSRRS